ncbi:substrate-binding domain-containing protein [Granulosicoccus antarcticus]|uniref:Phosphate-binding protein PstS n=1 Tax=Granulosicoccus antarcticus IMCC3135 TaxID=1192854 RepID=A0A2Z2NVE7_9GAMM|nr:substrate-binding domain-containing protein [Granulosicoccus antarcticus]ASJ74485.1 Phosphate-binding protein PstS [Granulosicoccus antarcticus IMCC3135]
MKKTALLVGSAVLATAFAGNAVARDGISVVGSSTVYPFATVVAERFGKTTDFNTPKIESTGSGGGLKLFCSGIGVETPDITNSSRRMKTSEYEMCQKNGVTDVVEVLIGYDGIAVANSINAQQLDMGAKELYLALAKMVPNPDGSESLVENPYKQWADINPALPAIDIEVLGPPPTSGTRDAFAELAMEGGCGQFEFIENMEKDEFQATCHTMREDGAYIEAGENDNLIVQKLEANPDALGIFGFSFLEQNSDKVQSSIIDGHIADFDSIASGDYGISRPLYFYVKAQHIGTVPGIEEYLAEFTSEQAWGEDGYLADKGMIPLGDEQRAEVGASVKSLQKLVLN